MFIEIQKHRYFVHYTSQSGKMDNCIPFAHIIREETVEYTGMFFSYKFYFTNSLVFWIDLSLIN